MLINIDDSTKPNGDADMDSFKAWMMEAMVHHDEWPHRFRFPGAPADPPGQFVSRMPYEFDAPMFDDVRAWLAENVGEENYSAFSEEVCFKNPDLAFAFKMRFG